ncbi:putative LRR receptor-like serine/threonine-protein kinase [Abeliophyllum distichum]|uniref:LRR receptor-like serine/threonine-protein kinase n=1 Tax=Abeliophyllum distichum TaxID=126358 RepID=A0ABD1PN42_9LAMI
MRCQCTYKLNLVKKPDPPTIFVTSHHGYDQLPSFSYLRLVSFAVKTVSLATGQTNPYDALGVITLWRLSPLSLELNEDPCLPQPSSWVECNTDTNPRVTGLYLGARGLYGILPDFSFMDALVTIDLHQNSLSGAIPSFLGTLPKLKELDLANNLFSGSVPNSLACNKNLKLSLTGNPQLYPTSNRCLTTDPDSPATGTNTDPTVSGGTFEYPDTKNRKKKKNKLPIILGSTGSILGVFWIIVGIFAIFRHRAKAAAAMAAASAAGKDGIPSNPNPSLSPDQSSSSIEEMPIHPHVKESP